MGWPGSRVSVFSWFCGDRPSVMRRGNRGSMSGLVLGEQGGHPHAEPRVAGRGPLPVSRLMGGRRGALGRPQLDGAGRPASHRPPAACPASPKGGFSWPTHPAGGSSLLSFARGCHSGWTAGGWAGGSFPMGEHAAPGAGGGENGGGWFTVPTCWARRIIGGRGDQPGGGGGSLLLS